MPDHAEEWETQLREHAAVAEFCGPYKLVFDEVADPERLYPLLGRVCHGALHVKTSAASYLEALRVVAEVAPELFREIAAVGGPGSQDVPDLAGAAAWLDDPEGRRRLNHAFGPVWTAAQTASGQPCKQALLEVVDRYLNVYAGALATHFEQQFSWLEAG